MRDDENNEFGAGGTAPEDLPDSPAPVVPDELIKGDWRRRLVLPNEDGQLRLTPVRTVRGAGNGPSTQIRFLDDNRRHSA
jgi:hypothetical protein